MMSNNAGVKNFNKEESGLYPVRVQIWGPFIYVNLSGDAPPLEEYLGRVVTDLAAFPFDKLRTVKSDSFEVNANWKLLAEKYAFTGDMLPLLPRENCSCYVSESTVILIFTT